jgi:hypothetical protein
MEENMGQSTVDVLADIYSIVRGGSDLWRIYSIISMIPRPWRTALATLGRKCRR